ncbi:small, acid-soluble spore protein, alpha/beta type [Clostridium sp. Marseille-P299]|uniref:small, acid-soluble spore protein, alpha/beta type n=1 Tax=Clostridium sp. Marseille-P299 TaxID=1805477 RepID=UPI00082C6E8E|nr:small, acid-soluble spore protein, alpha/beta type [Clostridium sp. Marseille-P299]
MAKKKKEIDITKIKPEEMMKYEIAKELGLFDKVLKEGWGALSAKETGRIGGMITRKRKAIAKQQSDSGEQSS